MGQISWEKKGNLQIKEKNSNIAFILYCNECNRPNCQAHMLTGIYFNPLTNNKEQKRKKWDPHLIRLNLIKNCVL